MILGTRGSALARAQSGWIRDRLASAHPGVEFTMKLIRTAGDRQQSLPETGPESWAGLDKGIFVKEIEDAMLAGSIDLAVHSLKDMPSDQPPGLILAAIPDRADARDAILSRAAGDPPPGARVGTGSPRRAAQLKAWRADLEILPLRGNVDTRVRRLVEGRFDAIVLALAGLERLNLSDMMEREGIVVTPLGMDRCLPAVGQGALAIETRADDARTRECVEVLHDEVAARAVAAERAFLAGLGGGCRVPIAAFGRIAGDDLTLTGCVAHPDGSRVLRLEQVGDARRPAEVGQALARRALASGASEILALSPP